MTNQPTSVFGYAQGTGNSSTLPFLTHFSNVSPTMHDVNYAVQSRWVNVPEGLEFILTGFITTGGNLQAQWLELGATEPGVATLTGNSGGAVGPTDDNIDVVGDTTTITVVGNPGTSTLTISTTDTVATSYVTDSGTAMPSGGSLTVAGGTGINTAGSGNTVTVNLTTPVTVAHGGTGDESFTAFSVITGGTSSTGALQNVSGVGTSGQVLTSNGASMLPSWQSVSIDNFQVNIQTITMSGTYTPTSGMAYCIIEMVGGGGGGGASSSTSSSTSSVGAGGSGGEYARGVFSAATIGASQSVTIGAGGSAGAADGGNGTAGGTTSVGILMTAVGGNLGTGTGSASFTQGGGIAGGTGGSGGQLRFPGGASVAGFGACLSGSGGQAAGGHGGATMFGGGGLGGGNTIGGTGQAYGSGGGGGGSKDGSSGNNGAAGAAGVVVITEYII